MSISDKIREAREWSHCIDTLKASVDSMYEICRKQQNFLGCEEAIMFLKNGIRDFLSLIDTIKIEQNWENSEKRPMAPVAWEIRGSISKNNLAPPARNVKEVECQTKFDEDCRANQKEKKEESGEWQLVERKKGAGRSAKSQQNEANICPFLPVGKQRKAPKSAMDLPQTKASMAKMAYSRQLLFEKHKKTLLEKFNARKRTENREAQSKGKGTAGEPTKTKSSTDLNQIILAEDERNDLEKNGQIVGCLKTLIDRLSDDCEWRAMTEEEESLAQEEESLKKEIEEEEENLPHFVEELVDKENLKKDDGTVAREGQNEYNNGKVGPINGSEGSSHFRNPGELAQLRAKLLSPTKRRRVEDIDHSSESKLRRAEELRRLLKQEKAQRLHLLHRRVGEVRAKREQIQQKKMAHLEIVKKRIQKAEEKRQKSLQEIVLKAQEDEMKIIESNLLNSFEAANQRLGKRFTQIRERNRFEKVVLKAEEERQKRIEDNRQQREEAEKRRKHAEEQRAKRLKAQANQGIERQFYAQKHRVKTMEKYRAKLAQHSQKVCQRKESELADKQKLLDKIQKKHEKRTENYEQCKEQVRRRAIELSSPRPNHYWAQTLADFSQMPSDLALQQRPINLERVIAAEHGQGEEGVAQAQAITTSKSCFRCGSKAIVFNDLQLLSHIMSEAHLAKADRKFGSILQSSMFSFDFLKNELEKMTNSDELTEVMTKSTDECSLGSMPMDKIIAKNAELFISDPEMIKLLMIEEIKGKNSANGAKKKRIKMRRKFLREFESATNGHGEMGQKEVHEQQQNNKLVNALRAKVDKLEESLEAAQLEEEQLVGLQRKVAELINALRSTQNPKERAMFQQTILRSNVLEKLLALNILISQRKPKLIDTEWGMRILTKSLKLFGILIEFDDTKTALQTLLGKTALYLCDLFQQNAIKAFGTVKAVVDRTNGLLPLSSSSFALSVALFIIWQFGQIARRMDSDSANSLFAFLCSCSLLEFVSFCAKRLEFGELLQKSSRSPDLELFSGEGPSACEVITSFIVSFLEHCEGKRTQSDEKRLKDSAIEEPLRQKQQALARNDSADSSSTAIYHQQNPIRLRLCAVLWMYCLSIIGYQHFRQHFGCGGGNASDVQPSSSNPVRSSTSSSPSSPSKNERFPTGEMTATVSFCFLRQFNAIAEVSSEQKLETDQTMLQFFLNVENGQTMALRMTCIFRSILQFAMKGTEAHENSVQQQQQQMGTLLAQCIRAIGNFAVGDVRNQLCCVFGWQRSLLSMLCTSLPLNFVHSEPQKHSLLPTLIAILRHSPIGVEQIRTEFCLQYLIGYLKAAIYSKSHDTNSESGKFGFLSILEPSIDRWISARQFFESIGTNVN